MLAALKDDRRPHPGARLLRRRRAAHRRASASSSATLPFDEAEFMQQLGVDGTVGRSRLHDARTPLGPADLRHQRPHERLPRRRGEDRAAGPGQREVQLPPRAESGPGEDFSALCKQFLEARLPPGIQMELVDHHGAPGVVVPLDSPYMGAAAAAIEAGFGRPPVFIREGGSIPIVNTFARELGVDVLLLGWGQNDDNTHSPNEKFCLADFHRGIKASAHLWQELAKAATA